MLLKTSLEMLVAADEGLRLMPYRCSAGTMQQRGMETRGRFVERPLVPVYTRVLWWVRMGRWIL